MKYIEEFKEDDRIVEHYLCKQRQSLKSKSGKTYLSLKLADKTGVIDAKVWDLTNDIQSFEENDFIKVDGVVTSFQNDLQLKVIKIRKSQEGEYQPMDYIPCTDKDIESLYEQLTDVIASITNQHIRELLEVIVVRNEYIKEAVKTHSAAKANHHSYMGGLLEHTLAVVGICEFLAPRYKSVNRDILVAGAILHDIAKVYELSAFPGNDYTDDGQLLGHIVMGAELITEAAEEIPGFPPKLAALLKHCVLAHHGEYEYGSPKLPQTIEAFILYVADNADAKITMFEEALQAGNPQNLWAGYSKIFGRNIRKSTYLDIKD
ncbi:MAG: HD domain-containing protein [Defluviitaleaceae bacterium]|nr:HD domain-containing protein [Defluviitaleaceae bacterium]